MYLPVSDVWRPGVPIRCLPQFLFHLIFSDYCFLVTCIHACLYVGTHMTIGSYTVQEGIRSPRTGLQTAACFRPRCWELNSCLLKEKQALLTTKPSVQPTPTSYVLRQISEWTWSLPWQLGCSALSWDLTILTSPVLEWQTYAIIYTWVIGIKLRSCLCSRHFTHWATSTAPSPTMDNYYDGDSPLEKHRTPFATENTRPKAVTHSGGVLFSNTDHDLKLDGPLP